MWARCENNGDAVRARGCAGGCGAVLTWEENSPDSTLAAAHSNALSFNAAADVAGWALTRRDDGPSDAWCPDCASRRKVYDASLGTQVAPAVPTAYLVVGGHRVGEVQMTLDTEGSWIGRMHLESMALVLMPRPEDAHDPPPRPDEELPRGFVERWKLTEAENALKNLRSNHQDARETIVAQGTRILELEGLLNSPELHDFAKALPLEAAHQVVRWGREHDAGKEPEDWLWVIGYLAGKAVASVRAGDVDKALHHVITTAAVCANWHAAIKGTDNRMRPGIDPVERGIDASQTDGELVQRTRDEAHDRAAAIQFEPGTDKWPEKQPDYREHPLPPTRPE